MRQPTLREHLRIGTADVHEALHRHPWFAALAAGRLDRDGRARLLRRMAAFHAVVDPVLAEACDRFAAAPYRYVPRGPLLGDPCDAAPMADIAPPRSFAALAGMVYVVDGALMGGAVLSRRDASPYWVWCRDRGRAVWPDTLALLARADTGREAGEGTGAEARAEALAAARTLFAAFAVCMTPARQPA